MVSLRIASKPVPDVPVPSTSVVVTGAAGWLGQNLVRALAAQDGRRRLRCLVHDTTDAPLLEIIDPRVEVVVGDVRDPAAIDRLFDDVGGASVMHAAAIIHPARQIRELFDVNVGGTQLVLDRARRTGATRFVHVSSNSPFGANHSSTERFDEDSPFHPYMGYGSSKLEAEQLVQRSYDRGDLRDRRGPPAVVLRTVPTRAPDAVPLGHPARAASRSSGREHSAGRWSTPATSYKACCSPSASRPRSGGRTGSPTPSLTRCATSSRR